MVVRALSSLPVQGRVDAEQARVRVAGPVGVDAVAQPLLLPHLLEQAGGHPAPQDGGEQLQGKPPGRVVVQARKGQGQVVLLNGLGRDHEPRRIGRRDQGPGGPGRQGGKAPAQLVQQGGRKAARQGHHGVVPLVVAVVIGPEGVPRHLRQGLLGPQDGAGQGAALKDLGGQLFRAQVVGGVLIHVDLLQDHPPFGLHGLLGEGGVIDHVPQDVRAWGRCSSSTRA